MSERQKHGFDFEISYIQDNGLIKNDDYTGQYDAFDKNGIPYQLKLLKHKSSIQLGDYFRNIQKDSDFYLVVQFWKHQKNNIIEVHELFIDYNIWNNMLYFDEWKELKDWIQNVSNARSFDQQWRKERMYWKEKFGDRKVSLLFKRDHKTQKRIQCGIKNQAFYEYFIDRFQI